ncbi:helix-turn-helix transcriptional regulator [Methanobacterium sp.]|uniref:helix-turn-helix transcriptional regulator n=1 Tax=Methanobacterium sp. TaxID=2164 RepID=UPI003C767E75
MTIEDILDYYEYVKEDLKFQGISSVRIKILISLYEGSKKTKDLRELTGIPASTILHGINELEKQKLISRKGDDFFLSEIGIISTLKLADMIKTRRLLKNTKKLWINHDIRAIPQDLLKKIGDLSNSKLIENKPDDMLKTHRIYLQTVDNSKEIKSVSPIFYSDYSETFKKLLKNNANVELILTEEILKKIIKSLNQQNLSELKRLLSDNKFKIWEIKEDIKVAFTVTDNLMILGLFSTDGIYDPNLILVSDNEDAINWGNKLFDYYQKKSQKINLEYFK